jgi:hypothetical protein
VTALDDMQLGVLHLSDYQEAAARSPGLDDAVAAAVAKRRSLYAQVVSRG